MNASSSKIIALLGPTNTGKTYVAIEKMLEFKSGIFGLPLRLLAREVYDKCVNKVGAEKVALITGEEKIIPSTANFFICTVESMPKNKKVDFRNNRKVLGRKCITNRCCNWNSKSKAKLDSKTILLF